MWELIEPTYKELLEFFACKAGAFVGANRRIRSQIHEDQ